LYHSSERNLFRQNSNQFQDGCKKDNNSCKGCRPAKAGGKAVIRKDTATNRWKTFLSELFDKRKKIPYLQSPKQTRP